MNLVSLCLQYHCRYQYLLRGCPITLFVLPVHVHLYAVRLIQARNSKSKKCNKVTIDIKVLQGTSEWECQFLAEKIKRRGHQRSKTSRNCCISGIRIYLRVAHQVPAAQALIANLS